MSEALLDSALRDLGAHISWPPEAELVSRVREQVGNVVPLRPRRRRRVVVLVAAALLVLAGLLAVSPGLRAAFLRVIGIRGAVVEIHETIAPPDGPPITDELALGEAVAIEETRRELGYLPAMPSGLGHGEGVFILDQGPTRIATVAYRDGDLLFSQFRGRLDEETIGKSVLAGQAERVSVDGALGIWVQGEHVVYVRDSSGLVFEAQPFLADNTLLWTIDGRTFRLEGAEDLDEALSIARTVAL